MIKANELRLGNYIEECGKITQVGYSTFFNIWKQLNKTEIYNYIELTEKWLLKANLTQTIQNTFLMGGFELIYDSANERYNVHTLRGIISVVRYVHQLQNLYFSLCGEELVFSTEP